jgi:WD40 repeat protein
MPLVIGVIAVAGLLLIGGTIGLMFLFDKKEPPPVAAGPQGGAPPPQQPPVGGNPNPIGGNPIPIDGNPNPNPGPGPNPPKPKVEPPQPAVAWSVKAGPFAGAVPEVIRTSVPVAGVLRLVTFPHAPSSFVSVIGKQGFKEVRDVWDLTAGRKVGTVDLPNGSGEYALSADGKYIAAKSGFGPNANLEVWSTTDGRSVVKIPQPGRLAHHGVMFITSDLVLAASGDGATVDYEVYEVKTGNRRSAVAKIKDSEPNTIAVSLDGRYLAIPRRSSISLSVYDLTNGAQAGEAVAALPDEFKFCTPMGAAFSPDGKRLAALFNGGFKYRLAVYDLATGQGTLHPELVHEEGGLLGMSYEGEPLEWLSDSSCVVAFGQYFLDPSSGKLIWGLPKEGFDNSARRIFGGKMFAMMKGNFQDRKLLVDALPRDKIDTAFAAVRSGKDPAASTLPAAVAADLSKVRALPPPAGAAAWTAAPDPAPAPRGRLGAQPMPVAGKGEEVQRILFTGADVGQAVLLRAAGDATSTRRQLHADRYDLAGGKALGSTELFTFQAPKNRALNLLAAVTLDGTRLLVREPRDERRVDVWSLADGKHVAGWLPAEKEGDPRVQWAAFVDPGRVLVQSAAGKLTLWTVPDCQAVWSMDNVRFGVALSPTRKYLAAHTGATYELFDPASGERKGQFEAGDVLAVDRAAFRADGKALAAAVRTDHGNHLRRWDLQTGKALEGSVPGWGAMNDMLWCGNDHVLAGGILFDFKAGMLLVTYMLPGTGRIAADSPDGRTWYVFGRRPEDPLVLTAQTLPDAKAKKLTADMAGGAATVLLAPGKRVALQLEGGAGADPGVLQRATTTAKTMLQTRGLQVAEGGADVRLVVHLGPARNTGRVNEYQSIGVGGRGNVKVPVMEVPLRAILSDSKGTQLWSHENKMETPDPFGIIRTDDLPKYLSDMLWNNCANWPGSLPLPSVLVRVGGKVESLPQGVTLTGDR